MCKHATTQQWGLWVTLLHQFGTRSSMLGMPKFTTRIQLEGEPSRSDYERLHAVMRKKGFVQTVVDGSGGEFHLPHAEYDYESTLPVDQVRDVARQTAESVWTDVLVFVTQSGGRSWYLRKVR